MKEIFKNIFELLSEKEKELVSSTNIDSIESLIPLLLKRVSPQNVHHLASLFQQSLLPSICSKTNEEIDTLFKEISKDSYHLLQKEVQEKIEEFI